MQIQDILAETAVNLQQRKKRELVTLKTKTTCSLDATSIFGLFEDFISLAKVRDGIRRIHAMAHGLSYSVEVRSRRKPYSYVANLVAMIFSEEGQ